MNKAALYSQSNHFQRRDAQEALHEFAYTIRWRSDGCDYILDCGCGSGDVTAEILMPILPINFRRLVGVDISKEMLDYARKTQIHPKLSFEQFDLCTELEKQPLSNAVPFDHIFSFYTFQRVPDKEMCLQNFHKLLDANGDMLLVFVANHPLYDVYKEQSLGGKWAEYMTDVDKITPLHQHSKDPANEFSTLLSDCGFTHNDVWIRNKSFKFESVIAMRSKTKSTFSFIHDLYSIFYRFCTFNECIH